MPVRRCFPLSSLQPAALACLVALSVGEATAQRDIVPPHAGRDARRDLDIKPEPASAAILNIFQRYQVVALADLHGCAELLRFLEDLVKSPEFSALVDDITWEPGNARFQGLMDDYILHGKDVPYATLCQSWRENTQAHTYSDTPALFQLLQTIRRVNLGQTMERRVRVLLIDPPVDWSRVKTAADIRPGDFDRERQMVEVLQREVYAKGRKALFLAGGAHVNRGAFPPPARGQGNGSEPITLPFPGPGIQPPAPDKRRPLPDAARGQILQGRPTALVGPLQTLEARHPGSTFTIGLHEGFGARNEQFEARLDSWPKPAVAVLRDSWWGMLPPRPSDDIMIGPDGKRVAPSTTGLMQDRWDAILYLGKRAELTRVDPPGADTLGRKWLAELQRRRRILGGPQRDQRRPGDSRRFFPDDGAAH